MTNAKQKPVLLTGASGNLGRVLARELGAMGYTLRLTDLAPFPDELPPNATFTKADLGDGVTILQLAEGCGAILHFGGASVDRALCRIRCATTTPRDSGQCSASSLAR